MFSILGKLVFTFAVMTHVTTCEGSQTVFSRHASTRMERSYTDVQLPGNSRIECVAECSNHQGCLSVNFNAASGQCELNSKNVSDVTATLLTSSEWEVLSLDASPSSTPGWYTYGAYEYFFVSEKKTWEDARLHCKSMSAYLADVYSTEEANFLAGLVQQLKPGHVFWLGGSDVAVEGDWRWLNGESIVDFAAWSNGQPDNSSGDENCLEVYSYNVWNDLRCGSNCYSFCKKPLSFN